MVDVAESGPVCPRTRYRSSKEIEWDQGTAEVFNHRSVAFDVRAAKEYLASHRVPVQYVPLTWLRDHLHGDSPETTGERAAEVEPNRLRQSDPDVPIVIAEMPGEGRALIDGNHRLERARLSGCLEVPIVVLPERVSADISREWTAPIVWKSIYRPNPPTPRPRKVPVTPPADEERAAPAQPLSTGS